MGQRLDWQGLKSRVPCPLSKFDLGLTTTSTHYHTTRFSRTHKRSYKNVISQPIRDVFRSLDCRILVFIFVFGPFSISKHYLNFLDSKNY